MRPKYSKDNKKRKVKTILSSKIEQQIVSKYESGSSTKELMNKYNISKSYISTMFKRRKIQKRIDTRTISLWHNIGEIGQIPKNTSGVYAIYFINKNDSNDIKLYIGSSCNISSRLQEHIRKLTNNSHPSNRLKTIFHDANYVIKYAIIEYCDSYKIMQKERFYLGRWSKSCLLNSWISQDEVELKPWLIEAIRRDSYCKNYSINRETGCKESDYVHNSGYARMQVTVDGDTKYFYKHRVAYWEKYGKYPELIRHLCNNPKCYNADHLLEGTHQDNSLDKRGDFPQQFEAKWLEFGADLVKLSNYYETKWKPNASIKSGIISNQIYQWERKLHLREKHPDIIRNNKNRKYNKLVANRKV